MKSLSTNNKGYFIYPGLYVPILKKEEVLSTFNLFKHDEMVHPSANVYELEDSFKVELVIPGVNREDFLIDTDENILSVYAVHKDNVLTENENFQLHEFKYACFDRHIILPENADTDFISAEYRAGILHLSVPKSNHPTKQLHGNVVVY